MLKVPIAIETPFWRVFLRPTISDRVRPDNSHVSSVTPKLSISKIRILSYSPLPTNFTCLARDLELFSLEWRSCSQQIVQTKLETIWEKIGLCSNDPPFPKSPRGRIGKDVVSELEIMSSALKLVIRVVDLAPVLCFLISDLCPAA